MRHWACVWMLLWVVGVPLGLRAQVPASDSTAATPPTRLAADTTVAVADSQPPWPRPGRAALLSLALPGLGQIYNRDYWKLPLVYGAIGGALLAVSDRNKLYLDYQNIYSDKLRARDDTTFAATYDDPFPGLSPESMQTARDNVRRQRDTFVFLAVLAYALNGVEAYVAAHLKHFDVSDDLSLRFSPTLQPRMGFLGRLDLSPSLAVTLELH